LTRAGAALAHERALRSGDARIKAGLHVAAMMGRVWLVALAVIVARYAGSKEDAVMAACLALAAFTVYFALTLALRGGRVQGRPSVS
jgi:hypothetical protein